MDAPANPAAPYGAASIERVVFDTPIKRGETEIAEIQIREPQSGELRDLSLLDLYKLETDAILKLLPRITIPTMMTHEVEQIRPRDMHKIAVVLTGFFTPSAAAKPETA